ncbi:MAG: murein biosynthesis integral rane protein MurJ [Verrucomicrobiota bacterium]
MSKMLKASGAMAFATLTSRVLGMVREVVYASFMGTSWVANAFAMAFMIPNLFRRLLGEGALTAAFIPAFKEKEKTVGEAEMWRAANATISALVIFSSVVIAVALVGISAALAWGNFSAETTLMLQLLRVMFPYMLLVCLAAVFMGMLNARGHFFIPAMGATMLNVVMISSVLLLAPRFGRELHEQIFALAIGVLAAGVAQAAFQLPSLRREGFRYQWVKPWGDPTVRHVVKQMIPGTIGVASYQINVLITQGLAFCLGTGVVIQFQYAVRLMELPQGVFGVSLATFLLPTLSGLAAEKKYDDFRTTLRQGLAHLFFVNLLASVLLVVLAEPIIRLIFERGKFALDGATAPVAFALACLAPGLILFSTVNVLARAFYALGDTKTPMKVSIFCLAVNLILTAAFLIMFKLGYKQGALGVANTMSAGCNAMLLTLALKRKLKQLAWAELRAPLVALGAAAVAAGAVAWFGSRLWEQKLGHANMALKFGAVFGPACGAALVYWALAVLLRVPSAAEMWKMATSRFTAK